MTEDQAQNIVNALLSELEGRGGFDIINQVQDDKEVYVEMYASLTERVQEAFASDARPHHSRFYEAKNDEG